MIFRKIILFVLFMCLAAHLPAWTEEKIISYDTVVELSANSSVSVSERIIVSAEGNEIKSGIFRRFPSGVTPSIDSIKRNGREEPFVIIREDQQVSIRIGRNGESLDEGIHVYEIVYEYPDAVKQMDSGREFYWNAVGTGWSFPVETASILVFFPGSEAIQSAGAWTGYRGERGEDYEIQRRDYSVEFATTRRLEPAEGFSVQVDLISEGRPSPVRQELAQEILEVYRHDTSHIGRVARQAEYAYMSWAAYGSDEADRYLKEQGWTQLGETVSIDTLVGGDVVYRTYYKDWEVVVAFRGTATGGDWVTNLTSPTILPSEQASIARGVAEQMVLHYPKHRLTFVGHSLGGRLAMVASARTKKQAVVFNSAPLSAGEWLSTKIQEADQNLNAVGYRSPDDILEPLNITADYYADYDVANIVPGPRVNWSFSHDIGILARAMGEVRYASQQGWLSGRVLERACEAQPELTLECPYGEVNTCVGSGCFSSTHQAQMKVSLPAFTQPKGGIEKFVVAKGQDLEILSTRAYSVPCVGDYGGEDYIPETQSIGPVLMQDVYRLSYFGEGTFRYLDGREVKAGALGMVFSADAPEICSDMFETWAQVRSANGETGWVFALAHDLSFVGSGVFYQSNIYGLNRHDRPPDEYPVPNPLPSPVRSRAVVLVNQLVNSSPAEREILIAVIENILTNLETGRLAERLIDFGLTPETVAEVIEAKLANAFRESARDLTEGLAWEVLTEVVAVGFAEILMESILVENLPDSLKSPMRALLEATVSEALGFAKTAIVDGGTVGPLAIVFPVLDRIQDVRDIYEASHAVSEARTGALLAVALGAEINAELNAKHRGERTDAIVRAWETDTLKNLRSIATDEDYLELREIFAHGFEGLKWQKLGYTADSGVIEVRALLGFRTQSARATNSGWNILDGLIKVVSGDNPRDQLIDGFLRSTSLADLVPTVEPARGEWKDVPAPHIKLKKGESYQGIEFSEDGQAFVSGQRLDTSWNTADTEIHLYFSPSRAFTFVVMRDWDKGGYVAGIRSQYQPFKQLDVFPPNYRDRDDSKHCSSLVDGVAWSPEDGLLAFKCIQSEGSAELGLFRLRDGQSFLHRPRWAERKIGGGQPIGGDRWVIWAPDFRTLVERTSGDLSVVFDRYRCKDENSSNECWGGWETEPYQKTETFQLPW